jgi:cholesterol transport system auxiliary component
MFRPILFLLLTGTLAGCLSSGDLAPRLSLDAGSPNQSPSAPIVDAALVIADPEAEAVFNTFNVAIATAPYEFEYLAGAEWTDRVPVLVRLFIERRFENTRVFTAVGDRTEIAVSDYLLSSDIRAFHIDRASGGAEASVAISVRLSDQRGRTLGSELFSARVPVDSSDRSSVVRSINEAAGTVADEMIDWTTERIRAAEADASRSQAK